jgi:hypothetical protein
MSVSNNDDEVFKLTLNEVLKIIDEEKNKYEQQHTSRFSNQQGDVTTLNVNDNTISCSFDDEEFLRTLTTRIETQFRTSLPTLTDEYRNYILNVLFEYHYGRDGRKFQRSLTFNTLDPFINDLRAAGDSPDAYRASWDGRLQVVQDFLGKYPSLKDKPGPWGTTFLYSAARNGRMPVVEYLVKDAGCSVNAQNEQHIDRALNHDTITAADYQVSTKAGSTALHGACYLGNLQIVQFLIEYGANYFIRNQGEETPMANAEGHPTIIQYFRTLLNTGYLIEQKNLPEWAITQMNSQQIKDCIWEYMQFNDQRWCTFQDSESTKLNDSLLVSAERPFHQEIQWDMLYTISMVRFLRSNNQRNDLAWIRCRGSSIFNFDCFALWQLFFEKYPDGKANPMTLNVIDLSMADEATMAIQLNTWYNCDAETNTCLNEAMNNRRKRISFVTTNQQLEFDLMGFRFKDEKGSTSGFIRWIPKLTSNSEQNKQRVVDIDNFQSLANIDPIPLTTKRLGEIQQPSVATTSDRTFVDDEENEFSNEFDQANDSNDTEEEGKKVIQIHHNEGSLFLL